MADGTGRQNTRREYWGNKEWEFSAQIGFDFLEEREYFPV